MQNIILKQRLDTVNILFRSHMFMCREVSDNIKSTTASEHLLKNRRGKVHGIWHIIIRNIHPFRWTQVSRKLCQGVLIRVYYNKSCRSDNRLSFLMNAILIPFILAMFCFGLLYLAATFLTKVVSKNDIISLLHRWYKLYQILQGGISNVFLR